MKRKIKDECLEFSLNQGINLHKIFEEIDSDSIQIGEDEHNVYLFNVKHQCRSTKNKLWIRLTAAFKAEE